MAGILAISEALKVTPSLTECKLRSNSLGVEGWTIIFNALRDSLTSKITTWDLSSEGLGPEIAKPLAEYISVTASVTSLNLSQNNLTNYGRDMTGITALAGALKVTASLTRLNVEYNDLGDEGRAIISSAVQGKAGFDLSLIGEYE